MAADHFDWYIVKTAVNAWKLGLGRMTLTQNIFHIDRQEFFLVFPHNKNKNFRLYLLVQVPFLVFEIRFLPTSPKLHFYYCKIRFRLILYVSVIICKWFILYIS